MTGMSGTFNASVQAQIDGQSTAPIGGTAAAGPSSSATQTASTTGTTGAPTGTRANAASSPSATAKKDDNGALSMTTTAVSRWVGVLAGVVAVSYIL
jgi:hypothetical protein